MVSFIDPVAAMGWMMGRFWRFAMTAVVSIGVFLLVWLLAETLGRLVQSDAITVAATLSGFLLVGVYNWAQRDVQPAPSADTSPAEVHPKRRWRFPIIAEAAVLVIAVAATLSIGDIPHWLRSSPPTSTAPKSVERTLIPITIDRIHVPIPECAEFTGQGDAPPGTTLWIVIETWERQPELSYYFNPVSDVDVNDHYWTARSVQVGSATNPPGTPFTISIAAVDAATAQLLAINDRSQPASTIPAGVSVKDHFSVSRGAVGQPCVANS